MRITALLLTDDRLWVGTGNGIILSVPLVSARPSRDNEADISKMALSTIMDVRTESGAVATFMPYCAMVSYL